MARGENDADAPEPLRILFVFAWLVVGGEETEVRLLAEALDPARYRLEVVACLHRHGMPDQTHRQLEAIGVPVDRTPYHLSFEETITYLEGKVPGYDIVVSCQDVADIYPALERMHLRPPLIEHGGLVSEALSGPKHFTSRYVGVCRSIRDAAASKIPDRPHQALEIPSMVDLRAFDGAHRPILRGELGIADDVPLVGWVGRLDRKKRVEDFIAAAAIVRAERPGARFVVIGGPDAFMPDYADHLRHQAHAAGLDGVLHFLGDRPNIAELLAGLDLFVWLSRGEGMPHVIAEAGAAGLAVIATPDNGALQQIEDGSTGVFVPHEDPPAVARAVVTLLDDPARRQALGRGLRRHVEASYSTAAVVPQWRRLFREVLAERPPTTPVGTLFRSFFQGGFECSTHRRAHDRERVDVIAASQHDINALHDYRTLAALDLLTVRDGLRWHLIERTPGQYNWSSLEAQLAASEATGTQVIWDVLHYGWPDDLDIWTPQFVERFAAFAAAAARVIGARTAGTAFYAPVNEISFWAWAGGDARYLNPFAQGRGFELKVQLTRAALAAMAAIRAVDPQARFVHADPVLNIIPDPHRLHEAGGAQGHRLAQYQGWDMLAGMSWPQLGGSREALDIVGVNFYSNNQWIHGGPTIEPDAPLFRPFRTILAEVYARYGRPIFVAETGCEGERRPDWLRYIAGEVRAAIGLGVPVEGICLYPILNHPGWDDGRDCPNGLLQHTPDAAGRVPYAPLAQAIGEQQRLTAPLLARRHVAEASAG